MCRENVIFISLLIFNIGFFSQIDAYRVIDTDEMHIVLALENEDISMVCKAGIPMAYCGFIHPSGKRYSHFQKIQSGLKVRSVLEFQYLPMPSSDQLYVTILGHSLANGRCAVNLRVSKHDAGEWMCHIGKRTIGLELMQKIELRVVNHLAAIQTNISAVHGKDVTLSCVTTRDKIPLRYCRFEPPNGSPFSIDSAIKSSKAILGKYYYPTNKSLDRGDCAVTIHKVKYSDVGKWTCGAGLDDGNEYTDDIQLDVEGLYTISTASTTGITFGTIGIVIFLIILGLIAWKKRRVLGTAERQPDAIEIQELETIEQRPVSRAESQRSLGSPLPGTLPIIVVQGPSTPGHSPTLR